MPNSAVWQMMVAMALACSKLACFFVPLFHISLGRSFPMVWGCHGPGDSVKMGLVTLSTFKGLSVGNQGPRCLVTGVV